MIWAFRFERNGLEIVSVYFFPNDTFSKCVVRAITHNFHCNDTLFPTTLFLILPHLITRLTIRKDRRVYQHPQHYASLEL